MWSGKNWNTWRKSSPSMGDHYPATCRYQESNLGHNKTYKMMCAQPRLGSNCKSKQNLMRLCQGCLRAIKDQELHLSRVMTKPTKWVWAQWRLRSAGHPPSLIRVFAVCMKKHWFLSYPLSAQRRLIRLGGCQGWSESFLDAHSFVGFDNSWLILPSVKT